MMRHKPRERLFDELNGRYFGGKLPLCTFELFKEDADADGFYNPFRNVICLRVGMRGVEVRQTILHEMIHAKQAMEWGIENGGRHDKQFFQEMQRLIAAGETCLKEEVVNVRRAKRQLAELRRSQHDRRSRKN